MWRTATSRNRVNTTPLTNVWLPTILGGMKRTTIWLSGQQVKALAKLSKKTGIKQAELIRRFIDAGIAKS